MTDQPIDHCPMCGAATIDIKPADTDPGLMLDWITITRKLTAPDPEIDVEASDGITFYDAMAMIHIAADTIAQGALTGDDDD